MKHNTVNRLKQISHAVLVALSMALSVNLFIQFSDKWFIQILFGLLAASMEILKLYILILAKYHFRIHGWKDSITAGLQFVVYLGLAGLSVVASIGFTFVSIEEQTLRFQTQQQEENFRTDYLLQELEDNREQIRIIQENASGLEFSAVERGAEANAQVQELQQRNREIVSEIERLRSEQSTEQRQEQQLTSSDMFRLLGESIDSEGQDVMFYMMLFLVFLLEVSIAITSGEIKQQVVINDNPRIFTYIDSLFSGKSMSRLKTDKDISEDTGIAPGECKKYRELLSSITYKGSPLIESRQGGTKSNFNKESLIKIIKFHNHMQRVKE